MSSAWEMWDPHPFRCPDPECAEILQHPKLVEDGTLGWCQFHGDVLGIQLDSQDPENFDGEEYDDAN